MVRYIEENHDDGLTIREDPPTAYLTLLVDGRLSHSFPLRSEVKLGRDKTNAVVTADQKVSRHHATLTPIDKTFIISDQGSANGTYINGVRIAQPTRLKNNDKIGFGDTIFLFTTSPPENSRVFAAPPPALAGADSRVLAPLAARSNMPIWAVIGCMAVIILALLLAVAVLIGIFVGRSQIGAVIMGGLVGII